MWLKRRIGESYICLECGDKYPLENAHQKTCSPECSKLRNNANRRRLHKEVYYPRDRERIIKRNNVYYAKNRPAQLAARVAYAAKNKGKGQVYTKAYYLKNKEAILLKKKAAYLKKKTYPS